MEGRLSDRAAAAVGGLTGGVLGAQFEAVGNGVKPQSPIDESSNRIRDCTQRVRALANKLNEHADSIGVNGPGDEVGEKPQRGGLLGNIDALEDTLSDAEKTFSRIA